MLVGFLGRFDLAQLIQDDGTQEPVAGGIFTVFCGLLKGGERLRQIACHVEHAAQFSPWLGFGRLQFGGFVELAGGDRKRGGEGKRGGLRGRRIIKKKKKTDSKQPDGSSSTDASTRYVLCRRTTS